MSQNAVNAIAQGELAKRLVDPRFRPAPGEGLLATLLRVGNRELSIATKPYFQGNTCPANRS